MSAARKGSSSGSGARKPAAVSTRPASTPSGSTTASTTAARKPRKPALDRALKLSQQVAKKCSALVKQAAKWRGDCTAEQKMARDQIAEALSLFKQPVESQRTSHFFNARTGNRPLRARTVRFSTTASWSAFARNTTTPRPTARTSSRFRSPPTRVRCFATEPRRRA